VRIGRKSKTGRDLFNAEAADGGNMLFKKEQRTLLEKIIKARLVFNCRPFL